MDLLSQMLPAAATGLLPVAGFLLVLHFLDTYRLFALRRIAIAISVGCGAAILCGLLNWFFLTRLTHGDGWYAILGVPIVEEAMKAAWVWDQMRRFRIAFMADSAIAGFAAGTGFALVENLYYTWSFAGEPAVVWAIRGFGTALMHGGSTALFGVVAVLLWERVGCTGAPPGHVALVPPVAIHAFYNSHLLSPLLSALCILTAIPALLALAFHYGDRSLGQWIRERLDRDLDWLMAIDQGSLHLTPAGRYLHSLAGLFPPIVVADMMRMLEVRAALSARAKGDLLRREVGLPDHAPDPEVHALFDELRQLRSRLGPAGMQALEPLLDDAARDIWETGGSTAVR